MRKAQFSLMTGLIAGLVALGMVMAKLTAQTGPSHTLAPGTQRSTSLGDVAGFHGKNGGHAWLGIPYAKPPLQGLRWKAPQSPERWDGVLSAITLPQMCCQLPRTSTPNDHEKGVMLGGEDCLYLNVFAPEDAMDRTAPLPVMVWIHGGGNRNGEGGDLSNARLPVDYDVIVVTLNYRLGPLGWLAHESLRLEGEASPNFANLDHVAALRWVQDNIANFGGNPDNVTVFGQSAGAANTLSLIQNPLAKGLFHRAIIQSGRGHTKTMAEAQDYIDDEVPGYPASSRELAIQIALQSGDATDRSGSKTFSESMSPEAFIAYLRDQPAPALFKAVMGVKTRSRYRTPMTIRDDIVIQDADYEEIYSDLSRINDVPMMFGTTFEENKLYQMIDKRFTKTRFGFYRTILDEPFYDAYAQHIAASRKIIGVDFPLTHLNAAGKSDVYAYRFDWNEQATIMFMDYSKILGAAHVVDVDFVHGNFDEGPMKRLYTRKNKSGRDFLSGAMMSYWAQFAHEGDPGKGRGGDLPRWTAWQNGAGKDTYMILDAQSDGGLRMAQDRMTPQRLLNEIAADTRFADDEARCSVLQYIQKRYALWTSEELAGAPFLGCEHPH